MPAWLRDVLASGAVWIVTGAVHGATAAGWAVLAVVSPGGRIDAGHSAWLNGLLALFMLELGFRMRAKATCVSCGAAAELDAARLCRECETDGGE